MTTTMTIAEAARLLGISPDAVRKAVRRGRLTARRERTTVIRERLLVAADSVARYAEEMAARSQASAG
jgi:excisionase family DNA binding protein